MDEESFCPANHASLMMTKLEHQWKRNVLCDVVLVAGDKKIPAHRLVLSSFSDYFAAMFSNNVREAGQREIPILDVNADALAALVKYMYTGNLKLDEETIEHLLSAACLLQMSNIIDACSSFLIKQLHPSNCLGILHFASVRACTELHKAALSYVTENFLEVSRSQEYLMLQVDDLCQLLQSDDLNVHCEEELYHAAMCWVAHDSIGRRKFLPRLLALLKLPLMSAQFLADYVESNELLKENRDCRDLIMEALKYHLLPGRRSTMQNVRTRARKSTVGSLLAVGGMDANKITTVEKYNYRADAWTQGFPLNSRRLQFGVAILDNKLYVVGGRDGLKTLNTVDCWDMEGKMWTSVSSMATHRHGLGVAVLEGPMYAVGGHDGWSYLNTVERWDTHTKQWSYIAPMHNLRSTAGVAVLDGKLYAAGGRDGSSCLRTLECFDPHTNRWTLLAPMAKRRGGVGMASCNGFLYAVGGHDAPASNPSSSRFDCVERYDPSTDTWTTIAPLSSPRDAVGVGVLGGRLFVVGGYDGSKYLNDVECYDPQTGEWTKVAPLCVGRAGACVVCLRPGGDPSAVTRSLSSLSLTGSHMSTVGYESFTSTAGGSGGGGGSRMNASFSEPRLG